MENTEQKPFVIDDLAKAEWALKKIAKAQQGIDEIKAQGQKMIDDTVNWMKTMQKGYESDIEGLQALMQPFVLKQIADSKKKSISLPSGRVGYRAGKQSFSFSGQAAGASNQSLINYLSKNAPDFIKTVQTAKWADYKKTLTVDDGKVITADGEILEDMTVEQAEPQFYTEVNK